MSGFWFIIPPAHVATMGLGDFQPWYSEVLGRSVSTAAAEVIDGFHTQGDVGPKYRTHLLKRYIEREGDPGRQTENGEYRTPEQARLDRAWVDVAETMDRTEGAIRGCVLSVYDGPGAHSDKPERLRADFDEILRKAEEED